MASNPMKPRSDRLGVPDLRPLRESGSWSVRCTRPSSPIGTSRDSRRIPRRPSPISTTSAGVKLDSRVPLMPAPRLATAAQASEVHPGEHLRAAMLRHRTSSSPV